MHMNILFGVIVGFIVLTILVVLHEFGHFYMAKKSGVKVNEFGIGFPPRAIGWIHLPTDEIENYLNQLSDEAKLQIPLQKIENIIKNTKAQSTRNKKKYYWIRFPKSEYNKPQKYLIFSLNYLPIGGFCAMDGESAADTRKGTFGATNFWQKTKILFGGVIMNWLTAIIIFTILAWTGMPSFLPDQFTIKNDENFTKDLVTVYDVQKDSPAEKAGIKVNSKIISMSEGDNLQSPIEVVNIHSIKEFNETHKGQVVSYKLSDPDGKIYQVTAKLNPEKDNLPALGIAMQSSNKQSLTRYTWSAPLVGLGTTAQITQKTFEGIGELVKNIFQGGLRQFSNNSSVKEEGKQQIEKAGDSVSGPVGIIGVLFPAFTSAGPTNLAFLAAVISISLACMNVLPIPALDGGRWFLIGLYKLRHKKLQKETEEKIVGRAFLVLIILSLFITILDIIKFTK